MLLTPAHCYAELVLYTLWNVQPVQVDVQQVYCRGFVLGPILFLLYTADLILLIRGHGLCPYLQYADDTDLRVLPTVCVTGALEHHNQLC